MAKRYNLNFGGIPTSLRILMIKSEAEIHRTTATEGAPVMEEKNPFTCGAATVRIKSMIFQVVAQREKKLREDFWWVLVGRQMISHLPQGWVFSGIRKPMDVQDPKDQ